MTEEIHKQDSKFICSECEFENNIPGYCAACDLGYMKKVCECQSGNYAFECCEPELEAIEKEMAKKIAADFESESSKELKEIEAQETAEQEEKERLLKEDSEAAQD